MELSTTDGYRDLLEQISCIYTQGRVRAVQAVNAHLIETYWQVGQHIVEFEQGGNIRADYGKALICSLATDLGLRHGKGFSRSNLVYMRLLYLRYPISQKPSHQLSWYVERTCTNARCSVGTRRPLPPQRRKIRLALNRVVQCVHPRFRDAGVRA
jgi:hypothetical protein